MPIHRIGFHPRIQFQLIKAGVGERQLENVSKYPTVFGRFHLITPHALQTLDRDPALLQKLNDHFASNGALSLELVRDLESKKLLMAAFGDPRNPIFYRLCGTSQSEYLVSNEMDRDFAENPTFEDIALCIKGFSGITIESASELNPVQLANLNRILDPATKAIDLIKGRGVQRVYITGVHNNMDITIMQSGVTNELTLYIPACVLSEKSSNVITLVIGALAYPGC
ncbi:MAG: hypothetical protein WC632_06660 [Candidatus Margulisiibacteriota bacterium]